MHLLSRQSLEKASRFDADPELAGQALRALWADQVDDDLFDQSMETLRHLRRLDPTDTTGAAHLWDLGWREYGKKNYSGAVGYWTELFSLYPEGSDGRRGRYWTARAFEALGETERAQQIYREVASSDTSDLYSRNAVARLGHKVVPPAAEDAEREPWPTDPLLARARLLTDLGLEDLAETEMGLAQDTAQPRAQRALEALILARKGERRKSILVIRDAFPALGTPHQAHLPEEARRLYYPLEYQDTIRSWATRNGLPTNLVFGIVRQESAFDPQAQSWAGARGLMQLMPSTARELELFARQALRSRVQHPARHDLLQPCPRHVRRQPGAGPRRLQRRPLPHEAPLEGVGLLRHGPLPRKPLARRVEDLRQADRAALGQLPAALPAAGGIDSPA
jgi:tetratricopeptide (TPR) repeat protein